MFGLAVQHDVDEAGKDSKNESMAYAAKLRALNRWLSTEDEKPVGAYRDPAGG